MLQSTFIQLLQKYTSNPQLIEILWNEIDNHYSEKGRHYHTLTHLQNLLAVLTEVQNQIEDWDAILFALFYHDIIYNPTNKNNKVKTPSSGKGREIELPMP